MGANVVGGAIQSIAAGLENRSMGHTFADEGRRQRNFSGQEWQTFMPELGRMGIENANTELGQGAAQRMAAYGSANGAPLIAGQGMGTAGDQARLALEGQARAQMGSYSDYSLNQQIDKIRTQQALNQISQQAQGSAQMLPYRMYQAQHSQDVLDFIGKAISSIGSGGSPMTTSGPPGGGQGGGFGMNGVGGMDFKGVQGGYDYNMPMMNYNNLSAPVNSQLVLPPVTV